MTTETITTDDLHELLRRVARRVMDRVLAHMHERGSCIIGVVGGRAIPGLAEALALELRSTQALHAGRIIIVWLDERVDHDKNFFHDLPFLEELCLAGIAVSFHPIVGLSADRALAESRAVEEMLIDLRGSVTVDIAILSAGEDGHIASLFPRSPVLADPLARYALVTHAPKQPPMRVTATPPVLRSATDSFLLFVGEEKRAAYAAFRDPSVSVAACPAALLRDHPRLTVGVSLLPSGNCRKV